jgi:hypothetical protein
MMDNLSELIWYDMYYNDPNIPINNLFIEKLSEINLKIEIINDDTNIENQLEQLEINYKTKLNELENHSENKQIIEEIKKKNSLAIMQYELDIIKLLAKYALQNNQIDYIFFTKALKFLLEISEILRIRLNQKEIIHENKILTSNNLPRCSYKFCCYKDTCPYNYNLLGKNKSNMQCYQDHYVHKMVSADLIILIEYIENKIKDNNFIIYNKEILKTINTLQFVINHMENELRNKCLYLNENEYETCHFINSI